MPRNRTARSAVLGLPVRRPAPRSHSSRTSSALRRRIVLGTLVVLSLALITISFREQSDGPLHDAQAAVAERAAAARGRSRAGRAAVPRRLRLDEGPLQRPLRERAAEGRERAAAAAGDPERVGAAGERQPECAARLPELAGLPGRLQRRRRRGDRAAVGLVRPDDRRLRRLRRRRRAGGAGRHGRRSRRHRDERDRRRRPGPSAHRRAERRLRPRPAHERGRSRPARPPGTSLVLDRVAKKEVVNVGDEIITAGWRSGQLASLYPKGIRSATSPSSAGSAPTSTSRCWSCPTSTSPGSTRSSCSSPSDRPRSSRDVNDNASVAVLVFVAALLQVTLVASIDVAGGTADVLLLSLLADRAPARRDDRRGRRLLRRAARRRDDARHARRRRAPLRPGRLLDGPLRRDHRARPRPRAAARGASSPRSRSPSPASAFTSSSARTCRRGGRSSTPCCPGLALNLLLGGPVWALSRRLLRRPTISDRVTEVRLLG